MSEDGESPQPEEQQPQQQKVPPTFTPYPAHAAATTSSAAATQRILAKRMSAGQRYISVVMNIILCKHRKVYLGLKLDLSFLSDLQFCYMALLRNRK
jgi:hypothetical protein